MKRRKALGLIFSRNCLLKRVFQGKIQGRMGVRGRRRIKLKQLLDNLKDNSGYWKLKEEVLDRSVWRTGSGRAYGPVLRQTTE